MQNQTSTAAVSANVALDIWTIRWTHINAPAICNQIFTYISAKSTVALLYLVFIITAIIQAVLVVVKEITLSQAIICRRI